jgi:hypothetical protein
LSGSKSGSRSLLLLSLMLLPILAQAAVIYDDEMDEAPPPSANIHNVLHTFAGKPNITRHAAQMGYDYTSQSDAHTYGVKFITSLNANYTGLFWRDGWYHPELGMNVPTKAEYDLYACMRNNNASNPMDRYYIAWVTHGDRGPDSSKVGFFINYKSQAAITQAINYLNSKLNWANIDAGFVDQASATLYYAFIDSAYHFSSWHSTGLPPECTNGSDYTVAQGFTIYRRALRDLFKNRGLPAYANPFSIRYHGPEVEASAPYDHYFNESGVEQDVSTWGGIPANKGSLEVPAPPACCDTNFAYTLAAAAQAGAQGSWFGSYGEAYEWIVDINGNPASGMNAIQLLRAIPNWDNLVNATARLWTGSTYTSSNSYADGNVVYSRHGKNHKLFLVFRAGGASVQLRAGETITGVQCVDGLFIETGSCTSHLTVTGSLVTLSGSGVLNNGYIVTTTGGTLDTISPTQPINLHSTAQTSSEVRSEGV